MLKTDKELFLKSLGSLLHTSVHASMRNMHLFAKDNGLSFPQMNCLFRMKKHGHCQVKEVGKTFDISNPAASQMLDKLVKMDFVSRKEGLDDRRVKNHDLTTKGEDLIQELMNSAKEHNQYIVDDFEPEEYKHMIELLDKLTISINKHNRRSNV